MAVNLERRRWPMPEQAVIVDTDTHFTEPPDLWTSRLPSKWGWDEPFPSAPPRRVDAHPATYDRDARLEAMDRSGVRVAVLYPNIAGLFMDPFVDYPDRAVSLAHV